jgi:peptide deformylase
MSETMYAANGAGLAAIQVGRALRLFIIDGPVAAGAEDAPPKVFINPEIVWLSDESQTGDEGCLSFPGIYVPVKRGLRARVRAVDIDGNPFEIEGAELFARAMQHENDHLIGRLLIDQCGPVKREIIKRKLRKEKEAEAADDAEASASS